MPALTSPESTATSNQFRAAMRRLPTSVVVVSGMENGNPIGMVVGTFTSVSMEPLLVGFLGDEKSSTLKHILELEHLSFNVLDQDDELTANEFRKPLDQRFAALSWEPGHHGAPVLLDSVMTFHTRRHSTTPAGDHTFLLAEVLDVEQRHPTRRPLVYVEGWMTRLDPWHKVSPHLWQMGWD